MPQLNYLHDLATSNRMTQGTIIDTYPRDHSTCKYRYLVDGQYYERVGMDCGNDIVGEETNVYFSPSDAGKSLNGSPAAAFWNDLIPFVAALILFPIFAAIIAYVRVRRSP